MSSRPAGWLSWSLVACAVACCGVGLWLFAQVPLGQVGGPARFWPDASISLGLLAYAGVGALIATRRPSHPIGWLFLAMGFTYQVRTLAGGVAISLWVAGVAVPGPLASVLLWALTFWSVSITPLLLVLLLFPDGRLPSRRWRAVVWLVIVQQVLALLSSDVQFGPFVTGPRPLNVLGPEAGPAATQALRGVTALIQVVALALGAVALVVRLRRAGGGPPLPPKGVLFA